jgi:hypothetical protein
MDEENYTKESFKELAPEVLPWIHQFVGVMDG